MRTGKPLLVLLLTTLAVWAGACDAVLPRIEPTPPSPEPSPTVTPTFRSFDWAPMMPIQTPAPPGEVDARVEFGSMAYTVLDVLRHSLIYLGGGRAWRPPAGDTFIDLFVKVENLGDTPLVIGMTEVYIVFGDGRAVGSAFMGAQLTAADKSVQAPTAPLSMSTEEGRVEVAEAAYLQLIYLVPDKPQQPLLFGIGGAPRVRFTQP